LNSYFVLPQLLVAIITNVATRQVGIKTYNPIPNPRLTRGIADHHRFGLLSKVISLSCHFRGRLTASMDIKHLPYENWSGVLMKEVTASPVVRIGVSVEVKAK